MKELMKELMKERMKELMKELMKSPRALCTCKAPSIEISSLLTDSWLLAAG
jgi:hypothetical protein